VQQVNIDPSEPTLQPGIAERAIDTAIDVSHNHEPFRKPARRGRSPQRPARLKYRASGGTNRRHPDCCGNSYFGAMP
jgi:hypothetical protein